MNQIDSKKPMGMDGLFLAKCACAINLKDFLPLAFAGMTIQAPDLKRIVSVEQPP
jgi:hypothetical protein